MKYNDYSEKELLSELRTLEKIRNILSLTNSDNDPAKILEAKIRHFNATNLLCEFYHNALFLKGKELFTFVLEIAVKITDSEVGFYHTVSEDQKFIRLQTWNEKALKNCKIPEDKHYEIKKAGVWADCVRTKKPVIINDYQQYSAKKGLPEGHTPIKNFMSIPVVFNNKVEFIFGVGNKGQDYTDDDVSYVLRIANELQRIVERNKREALLLQNREMLTEAEKIAQMGYWEYVFDKDTLQMSDSAYQIFESPEKDFPATKAELISTFHPDTKEESVRKYINALRGKNTFSDEYKLLLRNGKEKYVFSKGYIDSDSEGKPVKIIGIVQDITEKKKAELQLQESEKLFRDMFYQHSAIKLLVDPNNEGRIVDANNAAVLFYGYPRNRLLQMHISDLNILSKEELAVKMKSALQKSGNEFEFKHRLSDGTIKCVQVQSYPIVKENRELLYSIIYDITERKQTEMQLRESQFRLNEAEYIAKLGHWEYDVEKDSLILSDAVYTIFESPDKTFPKSSEDLFKLYHPEDRQYGIDEFTNALRNNTSFHYELRLLLKNGKVKYVSNQGYTRNDFWGKPVKSIGIIQDITNRKKIELQLAESEASLRAMFENAVVGIALADMDGKWEYCNEAFTVFMEYEEEELMGKSFSELTHPDDLEQELPFVEALRNKKISDYRIEKRFLTKSDGAKWGESFISLIKNVAGEPEYFLGLVIDITERKILEEQLRFSEERLNLALESSGDGIWVWNTVTNDVYYTPQWKKMLGYEEYEIQNEYKEWEKRVHPDDLESAVKNIQNCIGGLSDDFVIEHRLQCKDESYKWILSRGRVIERDVTGKPTRFTGTHTDINDRKVIENQLRDLNETKDKLISIISHDLRNPFHGIIASSNLLGEMCSDKECERVPRLASIIQESSQQAFDKLTDLLEWARVQTGRMEFEPNEIDMKSFILPVIQSKQAEARSKGVTVVSRLETEKTLLADERMLRSIIDNLITNAIKFSYELGIVILEVTELEDAFLFSVTDTGTGMPKEKREKLFVIDKSKSSKGTRGEQGTGLGLVLCKEFVEMHEGKIWVKSQEGNGTTFYFTIPKKD